MLVFNQKLTYNRKFHKVFIVQFFVGSFSRIVLARLHYRRLFQRYCRECRWPHICRLRNIFCRDHMRCRLRYGLICRLVKPIKDSGNSSRPLGLYEKVLMRFLLLVREPQAHGVSLRAFGRVCRTPSFVRFCKSNNRKF